MVSKEEARKFIGEVFGIRAFESPYGQLVAIDTVLKLFEPLVDGGFVIAQKGGKIEIFGLEDPPKVTAKVLDEAPAKPKKK